MRIAPSENYAGHCLCKKPKVVSKKREFGHLRVKGENDDDDPRAEKITRRWCHFARFFPCRDEGEWLNAQHELRLGKIILLRCFQNRRFSPFIGDEFSSSFAGIISETHLDN